MPDHQISANAITWQHLYIWPRNVAIESMAAPLFAFAAARANFFEPERDIYWVSEHKWSNQGVQTRFDPDRGFKEIEGPLPPIQRGLINVQSRRSRRQSRSASVGARHQGDLPPHGDEP